LNLTTREPVSPARSVPSLVGRDGRLHLSPGRLLRALAARQVNLAEVETEFREQITKVFRAGIQPTHRDGHKHVHVMPGLSEIVIRLAQEFSIVAVFARTFAERLAKAGILFPEHFYGLSEPTFLHARGVLEILRRLPEGVSELMCHPGYLDGDLVDSGSRLPDQREEKIRAAAFNSLAIGNSRWMYEAHVAVRITINRARTKHMRST